MKIQYYAMSDELHITTTKDLIIEKKTHKIIISCQIINMHLPASSIVIVVVQTVL